MGFSAGRVGPAARFAAPMRIGYLTSRYPAVSHSFVMREVEAVRRAGVEVRTLSIHRAPDHELLSDADREAQRTTFSVLPISPLQLVARHVRAFATRPRRYLATVAHALRLSPPGLRGKLFQVFYFAEAIVLWTRCERDGVRHIHAQFADAATDAAMLAAHFGGPEWSWSLAVHGPVEFYNVRLYRLAEKLESARLAIAISDFGRSQLMTLLPAEQWPKLHVVHCGVEPSVYAPVDGRDNGGGFEILCVGRLIDLKGQTVLVDAVAALRQAGVDARATLVGDGPRRADLERRARELGVADHVTLAGSVGQDRIREYYARAHVFCLASFAEGVPVVLMEAMAMGVAVVTTRIMGVPELVEHERTGLLVRPGRPDELVLALQRLAGDPEERDRLGAAGRQKVLQEYDVARSGEQLRAIFEQAGI
jgi:glycosyltransferase involved in cell wall biosynthesis